MKKLFCSLLVCLMLLCTACGSGSPALPEEGIPGMEVSPLLEALSEAPYFLPIPAPGEPLQSKVRNEENLTFEYDIQVDAENEIRYAKLSISAKRMSDAALYQSAQQLCTDAAALPYDTAQADALLKWLLETLPNAPSGGKTAVFGDASFTLYGIPELNSTLEMKAIPLGWKS